MTRQAATVKTLHAKVEMIQERVDWLLAAVFMESMGSWNPRAERTLPSRSAADAPAPNMFANASRGQRAELPAAGRLPRRPLALDAA